MKTKSMCSSAVMVPHAVGDHAIVMQRQRFFVGIKSFLHVGSTDIHQFGHVFDLSSSSTKHNPFATPDISGSLAVC